MSNYASLKSAIQQVIKTNGNNEITGALLQQSLLSMINSLGDGFQYRGIATPTTNPGTPDQNVFYIASGSGAYSNFGGLAVSDGEVAILKYNGTWTKDVTGAATTEQVSQLGQKVGKVELPYAAGYYNTSTGVGNPLGNFFPASGWYNTRFPVSEGDIVIVNGTGGSTPRLWCFVDSDGIILSVSGDSLTESNLRLTAPANAAEVIINTKNISTPSYYLAGNSIEKRLEDMGVVEFTEKLPFLVGAINSSGKLINDVTRIYCVVELEQGYNNHLVLSNASDFTILDIRTVNSSGKVTGVLPSAEKVPTLDKVGTTSLASLIYIMRLNTSAYIPYYKAAETFISKTSYRIFQDSMDDIAADISSLETVANDEDNLRSFKDAEMESAIRKLADSISSVETGMNYRGKLASSESETITLPHSDGGLFLLNVHRRTNEGAQYNARNNVYFPSAEKDFSDICVMDEDRNVLTMRKLFFGNVDVLEDSHIPSNGLIFTDSNGVQYGSNGNTPVFSKDYGKTWQLIPGLSSLPGVVYFLDSRDNLYIAVSPKLYRSKPPYTSYTEVLDFSVVNPSATNIAMPQTNIAENPDTHRIFIGAYQQAPNDIHILYSDDYGETWNTAYRASNYQHVHNITIDTSVSPAVIYVGCDGGGGILKSTDNGNTWTDLRTANPNIPQATDYGMIYCANGYRLTAGETSIVGGYTIQKTTDDSNFSPVLSCGKAVYMIKELNGLLFGGTISTYNYFGAGIIMSIDGGNTWKNIYTLAPWLHNTASGGFRWVSKAAFSATENQVIACIAAGGGKRYPVHILSGGDNYYAQFIVKVPAGVSQLTIESGHLLSKIQNLGNELPSPTAGYRLPLNADTDVLSINSALVKMPITPVEGGRQIADYYPPIRSVSDALASRIGPNINFSPKDLDLSGGNFHIGFWYKYPEIGEIYGQNHAIALLYAEGGDAQALSPSHSIILDNYFLVIGGVKYSTALRPAKNYDVWVRVDINFTSDNKFLLYCNGVTKGDVARTMSNSPLQYFTANNYKALYIPTYPQSTIETLPSEIQHFEITQGIITAKQAWLNYTGGLFDVE